MKENFLYFLKLNNSHQWSKKHCLLHRYKLQLLPLSCHFRHYAIPWHILIYSPYFTIVLKGPVSPAFSPVIFTPYCFNKNSDLEELALKLVTVHRILLCSFVGEQSRGEGARSLHFTSLSTFCIQCSPSAGGSADPQLSELWVSCTKALKESHLLSTQAKIYLESLPWEASEVDTKDKSTGEEVKSQVLYLLSGQEQGLHSALKRHRQKLGCRYVV